jgi:putative endonuclease
MVINMEGRESLGKLGERAALKYLVTNNYNIVKTNFRVERLGEIDIIATHGEYLCFIEVKTRSSTVFGLPSEAVTKRKQATIRKIASIYINNLEKEPPVRFDVVEIIGVQKGNELHIKSINLLQNAF